MRFELACACIDHLECRLELVSYGLSGDPCDRLVGEAELFCLYVFIERDVSSGDLLFEFDKVSDLCEEPHVDLGLFIDLLDLNASSDRFSDIEESLVRRCYAAFHEFFVCDFLHLL